MMDVSMADCWVVRTAHRLVAMWAHSKAEKLGGTMVGWKADQSVLMTVVWLVDQMVVTMVGSSAHRWVERMEARWVGQMASRMAGSRA